MRKDFPLFMPLGQFLETFNDVCVCVIFTRQMVVSLERESSAFLTQPFWKSVSVGCYYEHILQSTAQSYFVIAILQMIPKVILERVGF